MLILSIVPVSEGGLESFAYCTSIVWDLLTNDLEAKSIDFFEGKYLIILAEQPSNTNIENYIDAYILYSHLTDDSNPGKNCSFLE